MVDTGLLVFARIPIGSHETCRFPAIRGGVKSWKADRNTVYCYLGRGFRVWEFSLESKQSDMCDFILNMGKPAKQMPNKVAMLRNHQDPNKDKVDVLHRNATEKEVRSRLF